MTAVKAPGKWVRDLEPDTLLAEAARRVLTIRLEGVEMMLPLAAERPSTRTSTANTSLAA